jgi:predicted phage terminase large subunit-like protein
MSWKQPCNLILPHNPHPKQQAFLTWNSTREALFGGAAGGGKSDTLLLAALQYICIPGYSALLLRQTFPQLSGPDGFIDRTTEWLNESGASYNVTNKRWSFPSGATLTLGHCERDEDRYNFQSFAYQFVGVDELTQWPTDRVYLYVGFSRVRKPNPDPSLRACPSCGMTVADVPLRVRAATNPGGRGNDWVYERFVVNNATDRKFMPARISDNPSLDREAYVQSLQELDAVERARLLDGNWEVSEKGGMFEEDWFDLMLDIPNADAMRKVRFWDLAATADAKGKNPDWTVGALVGVSEGRYYILDIQRLRGTPGEVERRIRMTAEMDDSKTQIMMEQEPGASGVNTIDYYARHVLAGYPFKGIRSSGSKEERARVFSSACEMGNVKVKRERWTKTMIDECVQFPKASHDDQVDAISGAINNLNQKRRRARIIL